MFQFKKWIAASVIGFSTVLGPAAVQPSKAADLVVTPAVQTTSQAPEVQEVRWRSGYRGGYRGGWGSGYRGGYYRGWGRPGVGIYIGPRTYPRYYSYPGYTRPYYYNYNYSYPSYGYGYSPYGYYYGYGY